MLSLVPLCTLQVVCDLSDDLRVLGLHILGPNAGEVAQGFGTAMWLGLSYRDLVRTVGIHPTVAEEVVGVSVTKRSGSSIAKGGC
jgi:thioredoxin reductase (NADPH)